MGKTLTPEQTDALLRKLVEKKELSTFLDGEIAELEARVIEEAEGNKTLMGETLKAKITYRENVSYSDKDALTSLVIENQDLIGSLFRTELKESGSKVTKFLEIADSPVAKALRELRVVKEGKPGITVEPTQGS